MSKYRICYSQGEEVKYISHLDFLRTITRTFRRAEVPVKYSEGFNPHMVMTIGLPLSVGTTTCCDCLDIELTQEPDTEELKKRINECCPNGIRINGIKKAEGLKPLFNIDSALYETSFSTSESVNLRDFMNEPEVLIEKKSKRKINMVNLKDFMRRITVINSTGTEHFIEMHINAGNFSNLKPELVLYAMENYYNCSVADIKIERKEIYFDDMTRVF